MEKEGEKGEQTELVEIGPRFVLNPIRIFSGSFFGVTLYQNPYYVTPNEVNVHRSLSLSLWDILLSYI